MRIIIIAIMLDFIVNLLSQKNDDENLQPVKLDCSSTQLE